MYKKDRYIILCKHCSKKHQVGDNRIKYCSIGCYNKASKTKKFDRKKKCEVCNKEFFVRSTNKKMMKKRFCSVDCASYWRNILNNPAKDERTAKKISASKKGKKPKHLWSKLAIEKRRKKIMGENHWNWQGGITQENKKRRNSYETRQWRTAVFERDDYTCVMCGARNGNGVAVYLQADHIKPWCRYPELRHDINNGRTLCVECHRETPTYGIGAIQK